MKKIHTERVLLPSNSNYTNWLVTTCWTFRYHFLKKKGWGTIDGWSLVFPRVIHPVLSVACNWNSINATTLFSSRRGLEPKIHLFRVTWPSLMTSFWLDYRSLKNKFIKIGSRENILRNTKNEPHAQHTIYIYFILLVHNRNLKMRLLNLYWRGTAATE